MHTLTIGINSNPQSYSSYIYDYVWRNLLLLTTFHVYLKVVIYNSLANLWEYYSIKGLFGGTRITTSYSWVKLKGFQERVIKRFLSIRIKDISLGVLAKCINTQAVVQDYS